MNDYLAKADMAHELSAYDTKASRTRGQSLWRVLDQAGRDDATAKQEWMRAMRALGGSRRFHSGHLAVKLDITPLSEWEDEDTSDEVQEVEGEAQERTRRISYPLRLHIKATSSKRPALAMILRAARSGSTSQVLRMVEALASEVDRRDISKRMQSFWDWGDDWVDKILLKAATQPLKGIEVDAYLIAKSGRLCNA
jgi:hypothetical protein